jgi:hypothetical protein
MTDSTASNVPFRTSNSSKNTKTQAAATFARQRVPSALQANDREEKAAVDSARERIAEEMMAFEVAFCEKVGKQN